MPWASGFNFGFKLIRRLSGIFSLSNIASCSPRSIRARPHAAIPFSQDIKSNPFVVGREVSQGPIIPYEVKRLRSMWMLVWKSMYKGSRVVNLYDGQPAYKMLSHKVVSFVSIFFSMHTVRAEASWDVLPKQPTIPVEPTLVHLPEEKVRALEHDISRSLEFQRTYENTQHDMRYGLNMAWMMDAIRHWRNDFSWRDVEVEINRHPHFLANVSQEDGSQLQIHFMALFSRKRDAIPISFFHGWPGSFLEFMDLLDIVKTQYDAASSPYHIIIPSLPGFTLSSSPPVDVDWGAANSSAVMDQLLRGIGFSDGYVAQGGDIGSFIARTLGLTSPSCIGVHLNFIPSIKPDSVPDPSHDPSLTTQDRKVLARSREFVETGQAYALEQGTRPATLGFVLATNPASLLAWLGEKLYAWTDPSKHLSLHQILTHVSLYHLTRTIAHSFYTYRETSYSTSPPPPPSPPYLEKPLGYSRFPYDNSGVPKSWAETLGRLIFFKAHDQGGHFAAMEHPRQLWNDVEEFLTRAFPERVARAVN